MNSYSTSLKHSYTVELYDGEKTIVTLKNLQLFIQLSQLSSEDMREGEEIGQLKLLLRLLDMDIPVEVSLHYRKNEEPEIPFDCVFRLPLVRDEQSLARIFEESLKAEKQNNMLNFYKLG